MIITANRNTTYYISCSRTHGLRTNIVRSQQRCADVDEALNVILGIGRKRSWSKERKYEALQRFIDANSAALDLLLCNRRFIDACRANAFGYTPTVVDDANNADDIPFNTSQQNVEQRTEIDVQEQKNAVAKQVIDFFSEFSFTPSFRFINSMSKMAYAQAADFVVNYFRIQDHEYASEIAEKVKSTEFETIANTLVKLKSDTVINNRMKLYYGEPGTGKTTKAMTEAEKCVVCASDMLPADLMQNFAFNEGKAEFQKSDLWNAMENGQTIVLDEINMLPFESLRFLQGVTDGKSSIDYKGFHIEIKDGFNIIGTMNLNVGGAVMSIPAPLVDRCSDIVEFEMEPSMLASAI